MATVTRGLSVVHYGSYELLVLQNDGKGAANECNSNRICPGPRTLGHV